MPGSILGNRVDPQGRPEVPHVRRASTSTTSTTSPELAGAAHVVYVRSSVAHGDDHVDRHRRGGRRCRAWSACSRRPTSASSRRRRRSTRPSPARILASDRVRYVGEPIAAVVAETREQATDAAEAVIVDYDVLERVVDLEAAVDVVDASSTRPPAATSCSTRPRSACPTSPATSTSPTARSPSTGRFVNQRVAPCPLEVRGSAAAWIDGRLHQWVVDPARPGHQGRVRRQQQARAGPGAGAHARRRRRLRRQDRHLPRGDRARRAQQGARPAGALDRDPQRVDGRPRPRPGPGPARHHRRQPRRQGHATTACRCSRTPARSPTWARSSPRS